MSVSCRMTFVFWFLGCVFGKQPFHRSQTVTAYIQSMSWERTNFVIFSGKRKSGKDYVAHQLSSRLSASGISVSIIHLSEPIKRAYARLHDLDMDLLMSSAAYKEDYRTEMVRWGEERRNQDPEIFCREALNQVLTISEPPAVIIAADARRPSDLAFFHRISSPCRTALHLRIFASEATRRARGWHPVPEVDEADTECALDDAPYDLLVVNENSESLDKSMASVVSLILKSVNI
ncbi:hypothetical protein AAHC03_026156 [Spirometra sp. Aus1]